MVDISHTLDVMNDIQPHSLLAFVSDLKYAAADIVNGWHQGPGRGGGAVACCCVLIFWPLQKASSRAVSSCDERACSTLELCIPLGQRRMHAHAYWQKSMY